MRERAMRAFTLQEFYPGHILFREGDVFDTAYLLMEGEVNILSSEQIVHSRIKSAPPKRLINVRGERQWIGEDCFLFPS